MGVARRWVFPIIWLVVFAAIAMALVKIAFFDDRATGTDIGVIPTGSITEPQVPVSTGTIRNDVTLQATVNADEAVPVRATLAGEVRKVSATVGQWVEAGTPLYTIRAETPGEFLPDGTMGAAKVKTETVKSPITGTLSSFPVILGQLVSVGEETGKVAPPSFHVSGSLPPEQQYRLLNQPTEATVTITGGPAPFTCTGLAISTALPGAGAGAGVGGDGGATSGTTVRCAVPAEITVFAGLAAQLTIAGGLAENVLVVPTTAVEGSAGTGVVHVMTAEGATEEREVSLGLNDGINVEVVTGLAEGDVILQFIPGAPAQQQMGPDGCMIQPDGSTVCMGGIGG